MINKLFFLLVFLFFCISASSQTYEFPDKLIGFGRIPEIEKPKGIRSIIFTEQRDEHVFKSGVETFDKNNRKKEVLSQFASIEIHSGKLMRLGEREIYFYDSSGKLDKTVTYSPEGIKGFTENFKYDGKNMLVEQILYTAKGEIYREIRYIRNPNKREIEVVGAIHHEKTAFPMDKFILTFNDKGQCIKRTEYAKDGSIDTTTTYEYNEKGYILKITNCCKYNYGHQFEYTYDQNGYWIERQDTQFQTDKDGKIEYSPGWMSLYRIISYYEDDEKASSQETQNTKPKN